MNEFEKNYEEMNVGYNVCPHCGRYPVATMEGYDTYRVGCAFCGLNRGVITFLDDPISEVVKEATRKEWNKMCVTSNYTDEVMELMGLEEGDFVLAWKHDYMIECVLDSVDDVIRMVDDDDYYNIYRVRENSLELLGSSALVAVITRKY